MLTHSRTLSIQLWYVEIGMSAASMVCLAATTAACSAKNTKNETEADSATDTSGDLPARDRYSRIIAGREICKNETSQRLTS